MDLSFSLQVGVGALLVALGLLAVEKLLRKTKQHRLPPGPTPLPIVGNVLDLPPKGVPEFQHWFKHKDTYGPLSSITVMGIPLIIFHDKEAAAAIMGKKAQKTAARPQLNFALLCGFENFLITHQYNKTYRKHRKMVQDELGTKGKAAVFRDVQQKQALRFVLQTFKDPDNMMRYLKTLAAAIILEIMYGYEMDWNRVDPLAKLIEHTMDNLSLAFVPLAWLVDAVPAVKYLPDWFPGMSYRKTAREWKAINEAAAELPYEFVKQQLALGTHRQSYVANLLQTNMKKNGNDIHWDPDDEEAIKWTAVSLYAAGSDSTVAILESVFLAMLLFPEVVTRAHEEIDRVVGSDRLPNFDDRPNLPYIEGIVKETWRWNPVGPMGLTHKSDEDIVYGEYIIPKGSYLLPSLWWFLRDPKDYSDPEVFKPERYMEPLNELDPSELAFGYGRRSCSGRFFADASIYITIVQMLAVFNIRKAVDEHGKEIPVELKCVVGMVNRPEPFSFKVEPRSQHHADLLRRIEAEQEPIVPDARFLDMKRTEYINALGR